MAQAKQKFCYKHRKRHTKFGNQRKKDILADMLVTGAVITETIFSWPGIGPYFVSAVQAMDYPIVMSILVLSGTLVLLFHLYPPLFH